jgi:predicted DNA-binding transcriptional regulator YafY
MLHVHHQIPIARGGNHKLENLIVLCEKCHSLAHGGCKFDYANNITESPFEKKIVILRDAIASIHMIRFSYTQRDGRESVRTILPNKFEHIESSLCINGYCYLRSEARTFAIKRMKNLKHVAEPGECYYK